MLVRGGEQLHRDNPNFFTKDNLIDVPTAISMRSRRRRRSFRDAAVAPLPSVKYHNVVGNEFRPTGW